MTPTSTVHDLLVIGGGVNGVGIAADAAGRGLSVALCEMDDLASATSSNSSKLIHGGLRYLEYYEFRLVKEALAERETLLENAPHIMWPMRFILPHQPHLRPAWMIRIGLFMYDHLAKRKRLSGSKSVKFKKDDPIVSSVTKGFEYSDGWVDDARLVVLNAKLAQQKGATILTRTQCTKAVRVGELWEVTLVDLNTGASQIIKAKAIANAAGPWVSSLFGSTFEQKAPKQIRLIKGSHIVVPKIHDQEEAYILQNADGRIVFVIPYEDDFSLIGTTDHEYKGDPRKVAIDQAEIDYLVSITKQYFKCNLKASDVVHTYSGVRPLLDNEAGSAQAVTRDYTFEIQDNNGKAPVLSVFGGKITTYRKLAEAATNAICEYFPQAGATWTKTGTLPGGDFGLPDELKQRLSREYPWLPEALVKRWVRTYGTCAKDILQDAQSLGDLGMNFGASLYQKEVDYLITNEWAQTVEDIIWRRTKLGLRLSDQEITQLDRYLHTLSIGEKEDSSNSETIACNTCH
ncbi:MAG: glycerol-3-phosphate dehydrogenase [Pontibacterium sp.]